jgi:hypothetical protein
MAAKAFTPNLQNEGWHNEQRKKRIRHKCRRQNEADGATGIRENE